MRASTTLRQVAHQAKKAGERQTSADPFKYQAKPPSEFWDKFRKMLVVNPDSTTGMQVNEVFRSPPPASAETVQVTPASKASDPAENPYHERDFRRMYPRLQMITQSDLAKLLISSPERMQLPPPTSSVQPSSSTSLTPDHIPDSGLASLYLSSATPNSTPKFIPPKPPGKPYGYQLGEQPPRNQHAYFPLVTYR